MTDFKVGDKVKHKAYGYIGTIVVKDLTMRYSLGTKWDPPCNVEHICHDNPSEWQLIIGDWDL